MKYNIHCEIKYVLQNLPNACIFIRSNHKHIIHVILLLSVIHIISPSPLTKNGIMALWHYGILDDNLYYCYLYTYQTIITYIP